LNFIQKKLGGIMRRLILVCLAALLACGMAAAQSTMKDTGALTVIRAGSLIDGTSDAPRKNQLIFVRGKHIEKVAAASEAIPADASVIDLSNASD